ncbi:hypothetical protein [Lysinibacillus fusiformis]|uniref:hypothetical protein n=1 Tax=Lysinibacillus fusiformis TaxID=28031 RepID=UPI003713D0C9
MKIKEIKTADVIQIEIKQNLEESLLTHHTGYVLSNEDSQLDFFSIELGCVVGVKHKDIVIVEISSRKLTEFQSASMVLLAEEYPYHKDGDLSLQKFESIVDADFHSVSERKMQEKFEKESEFYSNTAALPTSVKFYTKVNLPNYVRVRISMSEQIFDVGEINDSCVEKVFRLYQQSIRGWVNLHSDRCLNPKTTISPISLQEMSYQTKFLANNTIGISSNLEFDVVLEKVPLGIMNHFIETLEQENASFLNLAWRSSTQTFIIS